MKGNFEQARAMARVPMELGRLGVRGMRWGGQRVLGQASMQLLGAGRMLTLGGEQHIAERLRATQPLSEARMGAEDVRRGLATGDAELTSIGRREVARGVALARQKPEVAGAVIDIATGLPVDPLTSELVRPEVAAEARSVLERFGYVPGTPDGDESTL